jgi:hypothetical protein
MNPVSETCVMINETKKVVERINCPKCNKPDMSKKNISTHYNKGCSGVMNVYKSKPIKKTKEQKDQEKQIKKELKEQKQKDAYSLKANKQRATPSKEEKSKIKKTKNPKKSKKQVEVRSNEEPKLTIEECYEYMCWLNEKKLFVLDKDNFKEYYNDYIMDMKEPIKLVINNIVKTIEANDKIEKMDNMISLVETIIDKGNQEIQDIQEIKLTIPNLSVRNFNQISEEDKTEIMVQEEEEEINYCISCQVNKGEEQYDMHCEECHGKILQIEQMIKDNDVVDEEEELSDDDDDEQEIKIESEPTNEIIKDDDDENYKLPVPNQYEIFFERYEYEYETEDEKLIVDQLNKFMQRFSEEQFKTYSDEKQGKSIEALRNKRICIVNWLKYHYSKLYYLEYNGNDFFIRTLLKLIKIKMDNFVDEFGNEDEHEKDFYTNNLTPQINKLINYYLLEMKDLMNKMFPDIVEKEKK